MALLGGMLFSKQNSGTFHYKVVKKSSQSFVDLECEVEFNRCKIKDFCSHVTIDDDFNRLAIEKHYDLFTMQEENELFTTFGDNGIFTNEEDYDDYDVYHY